MIEEYAVEQSDINRKYGHEQELARIESQRAVSLEQIRVRSIADKRRRVLWVLFGLGAVTVLLAIIAAIWTGADRERAEELQRERLRQQTAQACIGAGNIWTADGDCLIAVRNVPAPPPG